MQSVVNINEIDLSDTQTLKNYFEENGFLIIRGLCDKNQIKYLRAKLDEIFDNIDQPSAPVKYFIEQPSFFKPIINNDLIKLLMFLLGEELRIFPNFTARKNTYSPWHVDEAFISDDIAGDKNQTNFIQCSLFLQESSYDLGGGLDVIPTSHRLYKYESSGFEQLNLNVNYFVKLRSKILTVKSLAGDLIIWDCRLFHKSTQPKKTSQIHKYSLMWTIAKKSSNYRGFLAHLKERGERQDPNSEIYDHRYKEITDLKSVPSIINQLLLENHLLLTLNN